MTTILQKRKNTATNSRGSNQVVSVAPSTRPCNFLVFLLTNKRTVKPLKSEYDLSCVCVVSVRAYAERET
jgi:hypothetical protein